MTAGDSAGDAAGDAAGDEAGGDARTPEPSAALASFERMLASGKDSALLRYSIGNEHVKAGAWTAAADALSHAVAIDPGYTAAWKLYAMALAKSGQQQAAIDAYQRGIDVAKRKGDRQAEKEMMVFLRRLAG